MNNEISDQSILTFLYIDKQCAWPNCDSKSKKTYDTLDEFIDKHLKVEHRFGQKSHQELAEQLKKVQICEINLKNQKLMATSMMHHLNTCFRENILSEKDDESFEAEINSELIRFELGTTLFFFIFNDSIF
jgi:hypothetical protein